VIDLDIDGVAGGGDGVGRDAEGRVVFVPLTAPGDRVRAEVVKSRKKWASARMISLLSGAANRREPPCPDFGNCGGCRLQHLPEAAQAEAKRTIVEEALRRIGGIECEVPSLIRAGEPLGYRNRITLTSRSGRIGFRELYNPEAIAEIDECLLAEPAVRSAAKMLSQGPGLPTGGELRVTIRASEEGATALLVEGGTDPGSPDAMAAELKDLASYWWLNAAGERYLLAGEETFRETWQGIEFNLPPTVFLQSNRAVSGAMDAWLDGRIGRPDRLRIVDLYSGVGARAIRWALAGADVSSCEVEALAVGASIIAARRAGAKLDIRCDRVESQPDLLAGADIVIVNPPRTGLAPSVRSALSLARVPLMAYISCDPATLARDLKDISGAYEVLEVQPFDAFPQTAHVEIIAWLRARAPEEAGSEQ
jgi:23S rRNA (uracil1939-C5)-methyltransferase